MAVAQVVTGEDGRLRTIDKHEVGIRASFNSPLFLQAVALSRLSRCPATDLLKRNAPMQVPVVEK